MNMVMRNKKILIGILLGFLFVMGPTFADAKTKIMPLGDSITYGDGGYIECREDWVSGLSHQSWARVHWPTYNASNGATRPGVK
jgi:hypothetical protein